MTSTAPFARLHLLGGATLEGEDGPIAGRGAQRRRIALLAILAGIRRPVSRDKIMGLLWEEADAERARRLVSESLYVIRKAIGEDALVTSGSDIRINPEVLWCDVVQFHAALECGDDAAAVAHYAGPFLDGFFISDAPEFEKWLDGTRDTIARTHVEALSRLAASAEKNGNLPEAVRWWRVLAEQDPFNATYALGLMRALDRTGQRAAALQHARVHAALLKSEFDADPDASVTALAVQLKDFQEAVAPTRQAVRATAIVEPESVVSLPQEPKPPPPASPQPTPESQPPPPRRRTRVIAGALAIAAIIVAALVFVVSRERPGGGAAKSVTIAILPFEVRGGADADLRSGMVDILSHELDGAGELHTVDAFALLNYVEAASADISPSAARSIALHFGADYYLRGNATQAGGDLVLTANLYSVTSDSVVQLTPIRGRADNPMLSVDGLAVQLLSSLGVDPNDLTRAATGLTTSYPALKAWFAGENFYRNAKYREAASAFISAIGHDPTFALADYRLSAASEWSFEFEQARHAATRALTNSARLPERLSPLLRAWSYFLDGNAREARREYESVLDKYPDDLEALSGLGEVLMHFNPTEGKSSDEARAVFAHVASIASAYGEVRFHGMEFAVRDNKVATFDSLFATLDAKNPQYRAWQAVRAYKWGTRGARAAALNALTDAQETGIAAGRIAAHSHDFTGAREVAAKLATAPSGTWRAGAHIIAAELFLGAGHVPEARQELQAAAADEHDWTQEIETLLVLHPLANSTAEDYQKQRAKLLAWDPTDHTPNMAFFFRGHALQHQRIRFYLLGLLCVQLSDFRGAEEYQHAIDRAAANSDNESVQFGNALSQSLRGHVLFARGKLTDALSQLTDATVDGSPELVATSPFYSRAYDRYVIGRINEHLGRTAEARRWYRSLLEGFDFMYFEAAKLRLNALPH